MFKSLLVAAAICLCAAILLPEPVKVELKSAVRRELMESAIFRSWASRSLTLALEDQRRNARLIQAGAEGDSMRWRPALLED